MNRHAISLHTIFRSVVLLSCFGPAAAWVASPAVLMAQPAPRVVQGKVVDKSDAGLKGATVFLKDGHTLAVRSYVASDDGSYRFGQLSTSADYQLWAEVNGKKSGVKNISSFDTRNEFNITLKIDTK
jgi:Carboxypeptidase regulatory-like domain